MSASSQAVLPHPSLMPSRVGHHLGGLLVNELTLLPIK
jgi:hypothetical protein